MPAQAVADPSWHNVFGPQWMIRARGLGVLPDSGSSDWAPGGVSVLGPDIDINDTLVPELDITYFITKNIALELIAAVTPHTIDGRKGISALGEVGDVWLLPPTLTLQYHFEIGHGIKPYVGAGINYTVFFGEDSGASYRDLEIDNSFGFALQAGVDIPLRDNWYLNFDVKKLWLDTEASVILNDSGTRVKADVDVDPWLIGVGIGYRFGGPDAPLK
jgi:outer membrane protein